jgi:two-component system, chemotaxis family, chemotaxis protein CheY
MPLHIGRAPLALDFSLLSFLIVDDQPFSRRLVRSMLYGFGSRDVYESANGVEAFDLVRTAMPSIIITDLIMPAFNGLGFLKMVKAPQSPARNTPIIVLSGYLTKAATLTVRDAGADELLVKPVSPKALYEHIASVVRRDHHTNETLAFVQNQKRRVERLRKNNKKADDMAYV